MQQEGVTLEGIQMDMRKRRNEMIIKQQKIGKGLK